MGRVSGLRELGAALQALGDEVGSKIARQATGRAARIVKDRVVELAPEAPADYVVDGTPVKRGNLKKQTIVKRVKASDTKLTSEHVVTIRGKKRYGYASRIASIQEFGTVKQAPNPYWRRSWDQTQQTAADELVDTLRRGLARAQKKAAKK